MIAASIYEEFPLLFDIDSKSSSVYLSELSLISLAAATDVGFYGWDWPFYAYYLFMYSSIAFALKTCGFSEA